MTQQPRHFMTNEMPLAFSFLLDADDSMCINSLANSFLTNNVLSSFLFTKVMRRLLDLMLYSGSLSSFCLCGLRNRFTL